MSAARRHLLAAGLSAALALALLLLISLDDLLEEPDDARIAYREIRISSPPPPPPPPRVADPSRSAPPRLDLSLAANDSPVEMQISELDIDVAAGALTGFGDGGWGEGIGVDFGAFDLGELDVVPTVVSFVPFNYPDDLVERGIESFEVRLHILIDEEGRTHLLQILYNPYSSLNDEVERFVSSVRFTPPTKGGQVVRAEWAWPVKFGITTERGDDDRSRRQSVPAR